MIYAAARPIGEGSEEITSSRRVILRGWLTILLSISAGLFLWAVAIYAVWMLL
jgi:hypothetical protein